MISSLFPCHPRTGYTYRPLEFLAVFLFWGALAVFLFLLVPLGDSIHVDYYDAISFISQSRRLTDPAFNAVPFDGLTRPRALVMIFTVFDTVVKAIFSHYPTLHEYHGLMIGVAVANVLVWVLVFSFLWKPSSGFLAGTAILFFPLMVRYTVFALADILSGLLWGLVVLVLLWSLRRLAVATKPTEKFLIAAVLGFFGGILGITKHNFLIFFPTLLGLLYFCTRSFPAHIRPLWDSTRQRRQWFIAGLISWAIVIDVSSRVFGDWNRGIDFAFSRIYGLGKIGLIDKTHTSLYGEAIIETLGWPFILFITVSFLVVVWHEIRWRNKALSQDLYSKFLTRFVLIALSLVFLGILQIIPHREARYLIPFAPAVLGAGVCGWFLFLGRFRWVGQLLGYVVVGLALIHPVQYSLATIFILRSDPIYSQATSGGEELWNYLKSSGPLHNRCRRIRACAFQLRSVIDRSIPNDPYLTKFDFDPHYFFFTGLQATVMRCSRSSGDPLAKRHELGSEDPGDSCYVLWEPPTAEGQLDRLIVLKPYGRIQDVSSLQTDISRSLGNVQCETSLRGVRCFEVRIFYGL